MPDTLRIQRFEKGKKMQLYPWLAEFWAKMRFLYDFKIKF
jgi:hypothetical protein